MPFTAKADITLTGTVPLVADKVVISDISASGATISWTTNGNSTSEVLYDTSSHTDFTEYAFTSAFDSTMVSDHSVTLSDLSVRQTYYLRVKSTLGELSTISSEKSFTTLAGGETGNTGGIGVKASGNIPPGPGITNLIPFIDSSGLFNIAATASSEDGRVKLSIAKGVRGLASDSNALNSISIVPTTTPPATFADLSLVGLTYELGPAGATFNPAITLTFVYSLTDIPIGIDEEKLVLATWDSDTRKWIELTGVIDTVSHTITVSVTHFSHYGILAHTHPASFNVSDIVINPDQAKAGDTVSIGVTVTNSGDISGICEVTLKINGMDTARDEVSVPGGCCRTVTLITTQKTAGMYKVDVNGLTGSFTVVETVDSQPEITEFEAGTTTLVPPPTTPHPLTPKAFTGWIGGGIIVLLMITVLFLYRSISRCKK